MHFLIPTYKTCSFSRGACRAGLSLQNQSSLPNSQSWGYGFRAIRCYLVGGLVLRKHGQSVKKNESDFHLLVEVDHVVSNLHVHYGVLKKPASLWHVPSLLSSIQRHNESHLFEFLKLYTQFVMSFLCQWNLITEPCITGHDTGWSSTPVEYPKLV